MPTPQQLLKAGRESMAADKGRTLRKPTLPLTTAKPRAGGGSSTLYQEGSPTPKVTAKPDPNAGIGGGQSSGASGGGSAMRTYPGFKPAGAPNTPTLSSGAGRPQVAAPPPPSPPGGGQQTINMDAPVSKPAVQPPQVTSPPEPPAWQKLAAMGVGGQGSPAANRAKLAELQAAQGSPAGAPPAGPQVTVGVPAPDHIATPAGPAPRVALPPAGDQTTMETGGEAVNSFPGFKPRPGAGLPTARGFGGGLRPPLGSAADPAGAVDGGGMGPGSSGDFSAFGGGTGGGFGDLARVGAGVAARRRFPVAF